MHPLFVRIAAALGVLSHITPSTAEFSSHCTDICLDEMHPNILVTRCSSASYFGGAYKWSEFDLNTIFAYRAPYIVYEENGNFSVDSHPFHQYAPSTTNPEETDASLYNVAGDICYGDKFGPICGKDTPRTC
ncbi:hypothetical protein Sste5346_007348 [Sporothrix stenoceras]|uniref:Uncharacterized protein n=1 Tax=Sporothrix stenoceras TaxID=5173 RepID=A0ABR3YVJ4_9PEZI